MTGAGPGLGRRLPGPDGTAICDYIHVEDLARAHLLALDAAEGGRHAIYNLSNSQGYSVRQVIETAVKSRSGPSMQPTPARRPGDPAVLVASSALAAADLGWTPEEPPLRHGRRCLDMADELDDSLTGEENQKRRHQ